MNDEVAKEVIDGLRAELARAQANLDRPVFVRPGCQVCGGIGGGHLVGCDDVVQASHVRQRIIDEQKATILRRDATIAALSEVQTRLSKYEPLPHQWRAVACERADSTTTGRFNVVREEPERWTDSEGVQRPYWKHHGAGDFTEDRAKELADHLNRADSTASVDAGNEFLERLAQVERELEEARSQLKHTIEHDRIGREGAVARQAEMQGELDRVTATAARLVVENDNLKRVLRGGKN